MVLCLEDSTPEYGGTLIDFIRIDSEKLTSFEPLMRILTMHTCRRHSIPTMTGQRHLLHRLGPAALISHPSSAAPLLADVPSIAAGQSRDHD